MRGSHQQPQGSAWVLERVRRSTIHHVEIAKSRQPGGLDVPTTASIREYTATRGQPSRLMHYGMSNATLPEYDDRPTKIMALD
jgi:hypothetical protein